MRDGEPACRDDAAFENPAHGGNRLPGAYLLRELLEQTSAEVHCLVRARNAEEGRKRIADNLRQYELEVPHAAERIVPVCGELAERRLGLSAEQFDSLAATIDALFHNGAYVNFVYPYQILRAANVAGTVEILRLATQTRIKPLHFVSTVSVFDSPEYATAGTLDEDRPLTALDSLQGGYAQSKCVAERLVREAGRRGLPVAIYRPGRVTADAETGAESLTDYTTLLLRLCIEMKTALASDDRVDMTPVDYVARAVVGLAIRRSGGQDVPLDQPAAGAPAGRLSSDPRLRLRTARGAARGVANAGDPMGWEVEGRVVLGLFLMVVADGANAASRDGSDVRASRGGDGVSVSAHHRLRKRCDLQPLGISCPVLGVDRLTKQVRFLMRKELLSSPGRAARQAESLVPLRPSGSARPLFIFHGLGGHVAAFMPLAQALANDRPIFAACRPVVSIAASRRKTGSKRWRRPTSRKSATFNPAGLTSWPAGRWAV